MNEHYFLFSGYADHDHDNLLEDIVVCADNYDDARVIAEDNFDVYDYYGEIDEDEAYEMGVDIY